jgi:hypothetical protein
VVGYGYQWTVFLAAARWGSGCFDGLLFNFVAPVCVPRRSASRWPTGGRSPRDRRHRHRHLGPADRLGDGLLFGYVTDRLGRARSSRPS